MPLVGIGTPPQPPTRRLVCPLPPVSGGGEHSLARKGLGESQFRRGVYTVVLFICTYFVDNPIPTRFLAPIDCYKIRTLYFASNIINSIWTRCKVIQEDRTIVFFSCLPEWRQCFSHTHMRKTLHLTVDLSRFRSFFKQKREVGMEVLILVK
jgi:hypothetical protein